MSTQPGQFGQIVEYHISHSNPFKKHPESITKSEEWLMILIL